MNVVVQALSHAALEGLPGDHHFYITFRTGAPGVEIPSRLKAQYPDEMTIVIQHQYSDLVVDSEGFGVTLKFQGRDTRLIIPLESITAFSDPSVNFGLQMKMPNELEDDEAQDPPAAMNADSDMDAPPAAKRPKGTGEVIALDSFRKK